MEDSLQEQEVDSQNSLGRRKIRHEPQGMDITGHEQLGMNITRHDHQDMNTKHGV